ncbi:aromatic ring-hydroxylating oxygenase subunit alpha [Novosphingobium taihuense]|uniref:Benzoate/toluate 1,2-dioxygenase alpha subunit n=1 Tax=Novosphingobium taihuense TaxID=260085 RepID=A0A7W7AAR1_9SPHN|nr:aromatic ring-hydroxylating dioxygenase subunit alpha [Novosphingobium taihuense]MBB4613543.1 benzoate/toluate 1,2-dioxygenase alpha subunit [Novosphingobium taihuense]TWH81213.1 benzoate/toluate 1,2-dioxygenase alpha subunit [Novosphingobium taihuense]
MTLRLSDLIDDRPGEGVFRVSRAIFTDQRVFDAEVRQLFEGGWIFLGLESQAPEPHDFFTTFAGRVPVMVQRDGEGGLRAFVNSCPHKGARLAQVRQGNARLHVCPYHSWSFDSAGRNKAVKWKSAGCYSQAFDQDDHGLAVLPHFANYRGFLFGSLAADVPTLGDYLGEAAKLLDLVADQSDEGMELVPGQVTFTYEANWKLQLENCSDAYHFTSAHPSYIRVLERRQKELSEDVVASVWENSDYWKEDTQGVGGGSFSFANGHVLNWGVFGVTPAIPLYERAKELAERHGEARRDWMFNMRNLTIFPNLQVAENASSQLRVIRPLAPGLTEMRTWCIAPRGESAAARRQRIRQYEDFFNPTGMATPDDTVSYENCQIGFAATLEPWLQGYARGMTASVEGGNRFADRIDLFPERSVLADSQLCDETLYHSYYRAWAIRMAGEFAA